MTTTTRAALRLGLCALAGTLLFLSCADFDVWPLAWLGMVPMLWVTFLLLMVSAALYEALAAWRGKQALPVRRLALAAAVLGLALGYGQLRIRQVEARRQAATKVKVGLVQANIGITEKWDPQLY